MEKIFGIASGISTPLMLAGFFAAVFFYIARQIILKDIFSVLTKSYSFEIIKLIINRFFVLSLVSVFIGFFGYVMPFVYPYISGGLNSQERFIADLKMEVISLTGVYASINDFGEVSAEEVREKAYKVGQRLLDILDEDISLGYRITKYSYASSAYVLAASVELDDAKRGFYTNESIKYAFKAMKFVLEAKQLDSDGNSDGKKIYNWVVRNDISEWLNYLVATSYSIKAKYGDRESLSKVKTIINSLPTSYKKENPVTGNEYLNWALSEGEK